MAASWWAKATSNFELSFTGGEGGGGGNGGGGFGMLAWTCCKIWPVIDSSAGTSTFRMLSANAARSGVSKSGAAFKSTESTLTPFLLKEST